MLYTRTYEIEFSDGCSDEYTANMIAENMYDQCDEEGNQFNLKECIVNGKKMNSQWTERICISNTEATSKSIRQPRVSPCVLSGKMGIQVGSTLWTSRK
jgi:hypothetical protein